MGRDRRTSRQDDLTQERLILLTAARHRMNRQPLRQIQGMTSRKPSPEVCGPRIFPLALLSRLVAIPYLPAPASSMLRPFLAGQIRSAWGDPQVLGQVRPRASST